MARSIDDMCSAVLRVADEGPTVEDIKNAAVEHAFFLLKKFNWEFLYGSASTTSEADEDTYTLTGDDNDCGYVVTLKYEDHMLPFKDRIAFERATTGVAVDTYSEIYFWTISGYNSAGFPQVKLWGTPEDSGDAISYIYLKRIDEVDPFDMLPSWMWAILRYELKAEFHKNPAQSEQFKAWAEMATRKALWIARPMALPTAQGIIDPHQGNRNAEINLNDGYGYGYNRVAEDPND